MDSILQIAIVFLPLVYLLTTVAYGMLFFGQEGAPPQGPGRARTSVRILLPTALACHLGYLVLLGIRWDQFPAATVSQALSAVAFAVAAVYAFVEWRSKEPSTGLWMLSLSFLFQLISAFFSGIEPLYREAFASLSFAVHASLALLGYAAFVVATGYGFLYLRLYSEIKRRSFSVFFGKLPPLEVLERLLRFTLIAGFAALTGAFVTGGLLARSGMRGELLTDPKILVTFATWLFYGLALSMHRLRRWRGRQMAVASLTGFAVIFLSLLAFNLLFTRLQGLG